ncbi:hypothetical protein CFC21_063186 [Triticum aestivum]|uniref:Sulfotransferase n=2 Tax=Triticum aestivum TaxID=4565 RepID=A0A9R1GXZ9_WHEAT|nr:flavonol 3-sulfotransferase-like [Aegilops tauschii subsp. strangulata]XP_044376831.1 flavonol 3-sulfotransferase-like [Triticum aestivum]KAF7055686.1 hypothetical protein CFC21_063186 [Triticum aestivum]
MAATLGASPCPLVGPVPFKGVGDGDDHAVSPPEEYADVISAMPTITVRGGLVMRQNQGAWQVHQWVAGSSLSSGAPPQPARLRPSGRQPLQRRPGDQAGRAAVAQADQHARPPLPPVAHSPDCKIVHACRKPKDMLISLWHLYESLVTAEGGTYAFSDLFENACQGKHPNGPIWDHVLGYWQASRASPERILFLRYEEMLRDPVGNVRELARILGVPFTAIEEAAGLPADIVTLCSIETPRGLGAKKTVFVKFPHAFFFRKGVIVIWFKK